MSKFILLSASLLLSCMVMAQQADISKSDAIIAEGQGMYKDAAELYKKAADLYAQDGKQDTFCIYKAGQNFIRAKEYPQGIEYLEKAASLNYKDKNLYLSLADGYDGIKDYAKAEQALKKGMEQFPEEKGNYLKKMAYHYYKSKEYSKAVSAIDEALTYFPGDIKLLYLKGNSLGKLNKYDDAIAAYKDILAKEPDNQKAITKLGVIMFKKTETAYKKEVKNYDKLKNPSRVDYSNYRKKIESLNSGYKEALPYLEKARSFNPNDKLVLNCLMISYKRLKMTDKYNEIKAILK